MRLLFGKSLITLALIAVFPMLASCNGGTTPVTDGRGQIRLLPDAPPEWRDTGRTHVYSGVALSDYINGGAEVYFAYGFREAAVREFENSAGARLTVEVYEMNRSENAYGIFSTDSAGKRIPVGADASYGDGLLRFWKGPFFVRILCYPSDPATEALVQNIGKGIADLINSDSRRPESLLSLLPDIGVAADSVCYFHRQTSLNNLRFLSDENLLGLGDNVDAITWEEILENKESSQNRPRQIVLRYPSESAAREASRNFTEKYIGVQNRFSAGAATRLRSSWLIVVLDAPSKKAANEAVDRTFAKLETLEKPEGSP
ncbi:hypothetical protein HZA56_02895 [Candidatus Poribacteria bacterium]|nr:hypothetical protein [Candidatus Poribacteria bacterium]